MSRTESKTMTVHPDNEQEVIDLMQKFHWSLLNSQEVKTKDSHLEKSGDEIQSVTTTEHYIKLSFSREIDMPNLKEIKELEDRYFSQPQPDYPKLFPVSIWLWVITAFIYGFGIIVWVLYFLVSYKPKKQKADEMQSLVEDNRSKILEQLKQY